LKKARLKLLDLCCRAGGASVGYAQAGFDVVGVINKRKKLVSAGQLEMF